MQTNNDIAGNNLQRVSGIGPAYAKALRTIGVQRFADLARFAAATELQQALREQAGVDVPLWKIENNRWLEQAQALAEEASVAEEPEAEEAVEEAKVENRSQQAGFSIFFDYVEGERVWQTRTYHDESGEEQLFVGVDPDLWVNWILEKADLPQAAGNTHLELEFVARPETEAPVEILEVDVLENQPTFGDLEGRLTADIHFQLVDETILTAYAPLRVELYLVDEERRTTHLAASVEGQLQPGKTEYQTQAEFPFPPAGRYRLYTVVFLLSPVSGMAVHREHVLNFVS